MKRYSNLIYLMLFVLIILGCRKKETSWNSDWVVPIINDSLVIRDYINDTTLAINPDHSIQIVANRKLIDIDLTDLIDIPDTIILQTFSSSLTSIELSPGSSFIDEIKEHEFSIDESALTKVRLKEGRAKITIENPIETKGVFDISLPGVYKDGVEFSHLETVASGTNANPGVAEFVLELGGYTIDLTGENGQLYNLLQSRMEVSTDPEGPTVTLTNQDLFKTKVEFENLMVDYAEGYFGNISFSDTLTVDVEAMSKVIGGNINIEDLNLALAIRNGIKARAKGQINLFESINLDNNVVGLSHPHFNQAFNIEPGQGAWNIITPSELIFQFDQNTGNMESFLENLGREYRVGYTIEMNPLGNTSNGNNVIYPQSKLGVDLKADFPLSIGANDLTLQDTFEIDFKNDNKLLRVKSGKLVLNTTNTFPYGASIKLVLLDESKNLLKEVDSEGIISPAQMNSNGDGHTPIEEVLTYTIDENVAKLLPDAKFVKVTAVFNSTSMTNNQVYANAALRLLLSSELKLKTEI